MKLPGNPKEAAIACSEMFECHIDDGTYLQIAHWFCDSLERSSRREYLDDFGGMCDTQLRIEARVDALIVAQDRQQMLPVVTALRSVLTTNDDADDLWMALRQIGERDPTCAEIRSTAAYRLLKLLFDRAARKKARQANGGTVEFSEVQAAKYCGMSMAAFRREVEKKTLPSPQKGSRPRVYSKALLDEAMDAISGLTPGWLSAAITKIIEEYRPGVQKQKVSRALEAVLALSDFSNQIG